MGQTFPVQGNGLIKSAAGKCLLENQVKTTLIEQLDNSISIPKSEDIIQSCPRFLFSSFSIGAVALALALACAAFTQRVETKPMDNPRTSAMASAKAQWTPQENITTRNEL